MAKHYAHLPDTGGLDEASAEAWLAYLAGHRDAADVAAIRTALDEARRLYGERMAPGDCQLLLAQVQAASIVDTLQLDRESLIAAILADGPACDDYDPAAIGRQFGDAVVHMIGLMWRLREMAATSVADVGESQLEKLRRMLLDQADDVRVVLIPLARRVQLLRVLKYLPEAQQRAIATQTQRIHAPIANRLGVWQLKWELEDLSLRFLHPDDYQRIARALEGKRAERQAFIANVKARLRAECAAQGIAIEISGRPKHIYSIWKKMQRKRVDFEQIFDVRAVRVMVETLAQCYEVLGIVHGLWQPIPGEFDDYIARPKPNGYRSLHTAVVGEDGRPLEVQVRTRDMHEHAERGVAAHWRYKENRGMDAELERRIAWMRGWLEQQEEGEANAPPPGPDSDADAEFEAKRIYVFTPKGEIMELQRGSTAVDFAYAIHTSVGHRCRGAKADGHIIPLTQPLESGQRIEIITAKEGGPSRDWLSPHSGYLATKTARSRVRAWFKQQDYGEHVNIGRHSLDREIVRLGVPKPDLAKLATRFSFNSPDDLLAAIGRGDLSPLQVANTQAELVRPEPDDVIPQKARRRAANRKPGASQVIVEGVGELLTQMAKCCKPVPFDPVVGYITKGRGVTVHRQNCPVVQKLDDAGKARLVGVQWAEAPADASFLVDIQVHAGDRKGLLRDISSVFANAEIDVLGVKTHTDRRHERASMRFTVEVRDMQQLSRVLDRLAQVPDVLDVRRQS
jgi:GTP pyrophosphokinase